MVNRQRLSADLDREPSTPKPAPGRLFRRLATVGTIVGLISMIGTWLTFQHRPAWYQPVSLGPEGAQVASARAINWADRVSDSMVAGRPFTVQLDAEMMNEFLAATPELFPEVLDRWPDELSLPAMTFEDGMLKAGLHFERNGWRFIVVAHVGLRIDSAAREMEIRIYSIRGGSLPIPPGLLGMRMLASVRDRIGELRLPTPDSPEDLNSRWSLDDLLDGVRIRNRFIWPNGKRPFRIDTMSLEEGRFTVGVHPL